MRGLIWTSHPGDLLGEAIDFVTHGNAQHFGFLRADGRTVHELYLPQVRDRILDDKEKPLIRKFRLRDAGDFEDEFEALFDANLAAGIKYSVPDLFKILFNVPFPTDKSGVCSTYGLHCIRQVCENLSPLVRCADYQVSPRDHLISPFWEEESW
jgi:hypothetical protein